MEDQKPKEEDFMDFKDPFFDELDKIKEAATEEVTKAQEEPVPPTGEKMSLPTPSPELRILLERMARDATRALSLLLEGGNVRTTPPAASESSQTPIQPASGVTGTVIEGIFDGMGMIGGDGKQYSMSANYASKSKLVEGDLLKLTITPEGSFVYKQTYPIERNRVVGTLAYDVTTRQYSVVSEGKSWKVLTASVTYYKGVTGDEAVILIPKEGHGLWGAAEHIIKKI